MECTPSSLVYFRYDNSYMKSNWNIKYIVIRTPLLLIVVHFVTILSHHFAEGSHHKCIFLNFVLVGALFAVSSAYFDFSINFPI
jgi:hypothetical protein